MWELGQTTWTRARMLARYRQGSALQGRREIAAVLAPNLHARASVSDNLSAPMSLTEICEQIRKLALTLTVCPCTSLMSCNMQTCMMIVIAQPRTWCLLPRRPDPSPGPTQEIGTAGGTTGGNDGGEMGTTTGTTTSSSSKTKNKMEAKPAW